MAENFIMIQYTYGQPAVMYNGSDIYINKEMLDAVTAYFKNNRVDLGVRVETNDIIMDEINRNLYEGKFIHDNIISFNTYT